MPSAPGPEGRGIAPGVRYGMAADGLDDLVATLRQLGYRTIGPTRGAHAIELAEIDGAGDLPRGVSEDQDAGRYRLEATGDAAFFGFAAGPHAWKSFLHPADQPIWRATRSEEGIRFEEDHADARPLALVGVAACDLAAIAIHDRVFLGGPFRDEAYRRRREALFIVTVDCRVPGGTCFCVSQGGGPSATSGFDLRLTEIVAGGHRFLVEAGSERGGLIAARLPLRTATDDDHAAAGAAHANAVASMGRAMPAVDVRRLLADNPEHPRWQEVADRCLACGNCTNACPTCFCTTVVDTSDLSGDRMERSRTWDSCFSLDFSYVVGGPVRESTAARYRHWITHKLSTWHDQFGSTGCVGCGRCITWCPVGIDITEEVAAIAASPDAGVAR